MRCGGRGKKIKRDLQQTFKGRKEKIKKKCRTEGALAVTDSKFICKQAMKYDMTKSWRNFASTARLCLLQRRGVTASTHRLNPLLLQLPLLVLAPGQGWAPALGQIVVSTVGKAALLCLWQPISSGKRRLFRMRA